jgi:hypothetical protein
MASRTLHSTIRSLVWAITALLSFAAAAAPDASQPGGVAELFGNRVQVVAGAKSPLVRGDFDGDGKPDEAYFVRIAPAGEGATIAADVQMVGNLFGGQPLTAKASTNAVAIVLDGSQQKFLVVDFQADGSASFFASPTWLDVADWAKIGSTPLHSKKRGSADLKGYPCLGKPGKGDVLLLRTEAGIDVALAWTGKSFKLCENPSEDP